MPSAKRMRTRKRTSEESSTWGLSAQAIASSDDLLSEILLRLPIKTLIRFKSVSKQWLSLISDSQFISRKSLKSTAVSLLMRNEVLQRFRYDVVRPHGRAHLTSLTFSYPPHHGMALISSCEGLLLCSSSLELNNPETKYYVYNPTTRQFRTLPPPPVLAARTVIMPVVDFCLALDPPKSHSYRVACTQRTLPSNLFRLVVYSSETGGWRVSGAPFRLGPHAKFYRAVYCNGALHWIQTSNGASLCFDLDKELAQEIPLPLPCSGSAVSIAYFGESGGHLHLVQLSDFTAKKFPIYEMERDCSNWFVKFRVDLTGVLSSHGDIPSQLLHLTRGEKEEDSFLVIHGHDKVFRYYLRNKTQEVIYSTLSRRNLLQCNLSNQTHEVIGKRISKINFSLGCHVVYQYMESFSPV